MADSDSGAEFAATRDAAAEDSAEESDGSSLASQTSVVGNVMTEGPFTEVSAADQSGPESEADSTTAGGPPLFSAGHRNRSIETQTEPPTDDVDGAGTGSFPIRRAVSDWAVVDRSSSTAHIRSERIRRTAQLFEDLALAQEERQATMASRRGGLQGCVPVTAAVPLAGRDVLLVSLPPPPPEESRRVDAIVALGSGGRAELDSDAEGDECDEEMLWEKVRVKIAARRSKFQRLESGQDEPEARRPTPQHSTSRLSADRTSWLSRGQQAPAPSERQAARLKQQVAVSSNQQAEEPPRRHVTAKAEQKMMAAPVPPAQNGHKPGTTRSPFGKYIEQQEEQEVLRSMGNSVLARQKLTSREEAREKLVKEKSEAESRLKKAENQRANAQSRLETTKRKLTRDSAFERKGLEALITRLNNTIREETRRIDKLVSRIADVDASIEELRRRAAA